MRHSNEEERFKDYEARLAFIEAEILTIKEVSARWSKHVHTIEMAIFTGRLIAVKKDAAMGKRGGIWLIEKDSVVELWGKEIQHVD